MEQTLLYPGQVLNKQFSIYYPYYGLFASAEVSPLNEIDKLFQCRLKNGAVLLIRKLLDSRKWIDVLENKETALSSVIGTSIDDYFGG